MALLPTQKVANDENGWKTSVSQCDVGASPTVAHKRVKANISWYPLLRWRCSHKYGQQLALSFARTLAVANRHIKRHERIHIAWSARYEKACRGELKWVDLIK